MPARASVVREPLGVVLVIAPWNYPVQLLLAPLVGAIAAGNAVVLKPSELAPATSRGDRAARARSTSTRARVAVVEGGVDETTELLAQRFDHIFYTGNGRVGRIVMAAAVEHLTPVTLELGGKSPVYVDDTVDIDAAARRIAWGKFMNAGPDLRRARLPPRRPAEVARRLEPALAAAIRELYGDDPAHEPGLRPHRQRAAPRAADRAARLGTRGGRRRAPTRHPGTSHRPCSPTSPRDAPIMQDEIFGPILPIVTVSGLDDAIRLITAGEKPLALYVFSENAKVRRRFLTETSSGAIGFGDPRRAPHRPRAAVRRRRRERNGRATTATTRSARSATRRPCSASR